MKIFKPNVGNWDNREEHRSFNDLKPFYRSGCMYCYNDEILERKKDADDKREP